MKKINVIEEQCIGCGACIAIDSEHFDFDSEKGISKVISNENTESETVQEAIDACPVSAIELTDCNCGEGCKCGDTCNCNQE
ncbi:MAG: ferredoxin [Bacilli bacterium]|nr:ferredoxin [Bacilli bacterium]